MRGRGPWWARLRRWFSYTVLRKKTESCDACGVVYELPWLADWDLWPVVYEAVMGTNRGEGGLLCPLCFYDGAHAIGYRLWFRAQPNPYQAKTAPAGHRTHDEYVNKLEDEVARLKAGAWYDAEGAAEHDASIAKVQELYSANARLLEERDRERDQANTENEKLRKLLDVGLMADAKHFTVHPPPSFTACNVRFDPDAYKDNDRVRAWVDSIHAALGTDQGGG